MSTTFRYCITFLLIVGLTGAAVMPAYAQYGYRPRPPFPPPHYSHRHHHDDWGKALGIMGAVGVAAAFANRYSAPYPRYRYYDPSVVVVPSRPTVVVEKPIVVEKPVVIERPITSFSDGYFSTNLGAAFRMERMQIPGYQFTAARLTSDPVPGSPLHRIGLRNRDVITRLDNEAVDSLNVLERHERNTAVRYIKTGTTRVQLGRIYIPAAGELRRREQYYAP